MPKNQLGLSDLLQNPGRTSDGTGDQREADRAEFIKEYGIGIDCHSKFIEFCVRYRCGGVFMKAQHTFGTDWPSLVDGRDWYLDILRTRADPAPDPNVPLHYLVESTANYHTPVCMAWEGTPTVINPAIAGATKRKTDVPGSQILALHDQIGIWRECHVPSEEVKSLRVLISERDRYAREAAAASNRVNSIQCYPFCRMN